MSQADQGELRTALQWLELMMNAQLGSRSMVGFMRVLDIPVEAGVGDYNINDYTEAAEVQHVFSVSLIRSTGSVEPLDMLFEDEADGENLSDTGTPDRVIVTRELRPRLRVFPTPTQSNEDNGDLLRVRIQTFHEEIDITGAADSELNLRPSWFLWAIKRLSYEIGSGPVRRLSNSELDRIQTDYFLLENSLMARDGQENSGRPPVTEPIAGY